MTEAEKAEAEAKGLIETWDVLKSLIAFVAIVFFSRLIETWDVLKSSNYIRRSLLHKINRNMRCIEMKQSASLW